MLDIDNVLSELSNERPVFHSEADFQLSLFRKLIRLTHPEDVFLEHMMLKTSGNTDIMVRSDSEVVGIELKYKTKRVELIADGENGTEIFRLKDQIARDFGRYDFWKDVKRLKDIFEANKCTSGHVIFLTNDKAYWDKRGQGSNSSDEKFKIDNERGLVTGQLDWKKINGVYSKSVRDGEKNKPIDLGSYKYFLNEASWKEYSRPGKTVFKYLLLNIP